jgi:hypothetical protein
MGFKEARLLLIEALRSGTFDFEPRADIAEKNLLYAGDVDAGFVVRLLLRCAGWEYSTSTHHSREAECHIFTPATGGQRWYIKAYQEHGGVVFISVHP